MEKGPFSAEWLAQSSRGAREMLPDTARQREAAERSSPGHEAGLAGAAPGRSRTKFSAAQLQELERSFREQRYIGAGEKRRLAAVLNLSQSQVRRPGPPVSLAPLAENGFEQGDSAASPGTAVSIAAPDPPETKFKWKTVDAVQKLKLDWGEKYFHNLQTFNFQIKTWFQNRRMKFKRQTQDAKIEALFSGLFLPYCCYPDMATSSYPHGMDVNVSATSAVSLHPAMPNPAFLLPAAPARSLQPVLPSSALLLPPSPGLPCYTSVLPAVTLTTKHKRLMCQPDLPSC